jgi:hypothetical protein
MCRSCLSSPPTTTSLPSTRCADVEVRRSQPAARGGRGTFDGGLPAAPRGPRGRVDCGIAGEISRSVVAASPQPTRAACAVTDVADAGAASTAMPFRPGSATARQALPCALAAPPGVDAAPDVRIDVARDEMGWTRPQPMPSSTLPANHATTAPGNSRHVGSRFWWPRRAGVHPGGGARSGGCAEDSRRPSAPDLPQDRSHARRGDPVRLEHGILPSPTG